MKVSYEWLQEYFNERLPAPDELERILTMHAYEVEEVKEKDGDFIFDIDVLPNRASDSLCHRGIAREISVLTGLNTKEREFSYPTDTETDLSISIEDNKKCPRYIGKKVTNVSVGDSPDWLQKRLESIGQRPINNIVDVANYVMFDMGQPLHAFDADKVKGSIVVRDAKKGETMTTLDDQEITFSGGELIIADDNEPLALAGVKGGKRAEVTEETKNIILEAANFHPTVVRRSARGFNLITDASKRFEDNITAEWAPEAMGQFTALLKEIAGKNSRFEKNVDIYPRPKTIPYKSGFSVSEVEKLLGIKIDSKNIEKILEHMTRAGFSWEKVNSRKKVVQTGKDVVGTEYKRPSQMQYDAPQAFSCSSLVSYVFSQAGIYMPSLSIDKYVYSEPISKDDIEPGDLIFVNTKEGINGEAPKAYYESVEFIPGTHVEEGIDHVGIYMGDGMVLHTSWTSGTAAVENLKEVKQFQNIVGCGRVLHEEERYVVTVPSERIDIRIPEDLIEEVGRLYGYENVEEDVPEAKNTPVLNKEFYYISKIRKLLMDEGFSENYLYSFRGQGDIPLENPLAEGREFLRTNLSDGLTESFVFNNKNAPLLGTSAVHIFEIGHVFTKNAEELHLALAGRRAAETVKKIEKEFGVQLSPKDHGGVVEINLDSLIDVLPEPKDNLNDVLPKSPDVTYQSISPYPFVLRDIAVWVPENVSSDDLLNVIKEKAGDLLVQHRLFDEYKKDNKVSYAFNLVFQSPDRTLTDEEITQVMEEISEHIRQKGWEVR